ncbi:NUDIX hydrolase domain-like protein [Sordaria brevicollis]|uniref:NUDIX hydrolase domain-like protein n=1 Tax=Sordaria brevicollis TaxID=83679 RepID=A0AAE0PGB7_SORBR|nr:NUDIX hydrolase domain-like protein [Sordaria brevicollis]
MRNILTRYPALTFSSASATTSASAAARTRAFTNSNTNSTLTTNSPLTNNNTTTTNNHHAQRRTIKMTIPKTQEPTITSITELAPSQSKWLTLQQIHYVDQTGKARLWEVAARKTRSAPPPGSSSSSTTLGSASGVDAVAMANILLHPHLPPLLSSYTIEWPAGLIDKGETPQQAAVREFREETGFDCTVKRVSPIQAADPGMSSANMVMATVEVQLPEDAVDGETGELRLPEQRLEDGEHITRVVVPIAELYERLVEFSKRERHIVAAKLFHFAEGMNFAVTEGYGVFGKKKE